MGTADSQGGSDKGAKKELPGSGLITKYRPQTFDEVVGHDAVISSLKSVIKRKAAKAFLLTGPSGTGKTTLARIIAREMGCSDSDVLEIDAATYNGVDDMRSVTAGLLYRPLGDSEAKALIVDEFHALSKAAVQALLKILEEPPSWVVWLLCTTEPSRVPANIKTRCAPYDLKPVPFKELQELLDSVVAKEKLKTPEAVVDLCADEAQGSPRQALSNLAICAEAQDEDEAASLLQTALTSEEAVNLARALVNGKSWKEVQVILKGLEDTNPESIRHVVRAYVTSMAINAKSENAAGQALTILDAFSEPFNSGDKLSPVVLACGKVLLQ